MLVCLSFVICSLSSYSLDDDDELIVRLTSTMLLYTRSICPHIVHEYSTDTVY